MCWNSYKGHHEGQELHHSIRPEQPRGSREQLAADGERSGAPACLDPQYFFSCQHGKEPGKPAAQFQGYVIPRTCKPGRPGPNCSDWAILLKIVCFPEPGYNSPTVPAANEVEQRSSVSQFVLHIFHLLKFPQFYSSPNVLIHRACVSAYIFLFVICKAVEHHGHNFPRECCRFIAAQGKLSNSDWTSNFGRAIRAIL